MNMTVNRAIAVASVTLALLVLVFRPVSAEQAPALALIIATVGLWATAVLPEFITSLAFLTLAMVFAVAPANVVFAGFQSPALWLIFGGLMMGLVVRSSGLGARLAQRMAASFGASYWGVIAGIACVGTTLGFLMPSSMGRVVLLMPIALSLADGFGFAPGSNGRIGVVLAAAFGAHVATFSILPANVPNVVLAGAAESLYHMTFTYGRYLLIHFPVLGLLKLVLLIPLIVLGWPDTPRSIPVTELPPMSGSEKWLSVVLATALILWATDSMHHINPAWVSLSAGVILLMPGIGLIGVKEFNEQVNFGSLFYIGGVIGMGALLNQSGLGNSLSQTMLSFLPMVPLNFAADFTSLAAMATIVSAVTTVTAAPAVLAPLAAHLADVTGLSLEAVLHSEVLGFSNPILPYASPPMVVALALSGERVGPAQRLCLMLAGLTICVLWPLDYMWWRLLGMI